MHYATCNADDGSIHYNVNAQPFSSASRKVEEATQPGAVSVEEVVQLVSEIQSCIIH